MSRNEPIEIIESWLADGPNAAPDRLVARLSGQLRETPQVPGSVLLRSAWALVPLAAAAVILGLAIVTSVLPPRIGDPPPASAAPSPPARFEEGARVDIVLLIENRSAVAHGSWYWSGYSAGMPTAEPCHAIVVAEKVRAPGIIRFGEVEPDTEVGPERETLPPMLSTDALPGEPIAYRDDLVPVWTYAYRIGVARDGAVSIEPLETAPSAADAGPICPVPDTSWPGGWPVVQAWLAQRPVLPDCGVEVRHMWPEGERSANTEARRCFHDAWAEGAEAQLVFVTFTDVGPTIEVMRASEGEIEMAFQDLRPSAEGQFTGATCSGLVPLPDDETLVFGIDPDSCRERRLLEDATVTP